MRESTRCPSIWRLRNQASFGHLYLGVPSPSYCRSLPGESGRPMSCASSAQRRGLQGARIHDRAESDLSAAARKRHRSRSRTLKIARVSDRSRNHQVVGSTSDNQPVRRGRAPRRAQDLHRNSRARPPLWLRTGRVLDLLLTSPRCLRVRMCRIPKPRSVLWSTGLERQKPSIRNYQVAARSEIFV